MDIALQIATGLGLASCAGLRAFLPLFVAGAAARAGWLELGDAFAWLSSTPALVILGTATVAEILADKIPAVDHALDAAGTVVRPVAGALVLASTLGDASPLAAAVLGLILGAPAAGGLHLLKAKARLLTSATTLGAANPAQSAVEDALSATGCVLCVVLPFLALLLLIVAAVLVLRRWRRAPAR
jgi:hypothetical protein